MPNHISLLTLTSGQWPPPLLLMSLGQLPVAAKRNHIFRSSWTYRSKVFFGKQVCNRVLYCLGACGNRCMLDCGRWKDGIWYGLHPTSAQAGFLSPLQHAIYHLIMWGNMQHTNVMWCDALCFSFGFGFRLWLPWIFVFVCVCVCVFVMRGCLAGEGGS